MPWTSGCCARSTTSPAHLRHLQDGTGQATLWPSWTSTGKVHGDCDGLRVVDASIMPDCIRANTNVTTMMIGERVSELMLQGN